MKGAFKVVKEIGKKVSKKRGTKTSVKSYVRFSDKLTASLEEVNLVIQENKATLDAIQDIALELARVAGVLEATASKYVNMVNSVLETAVPILSNIPLVPEKTLEVVTELQDLAKDILQVCTTADKVIRDVEDGLLNADVTKLKAHTGDLQKMTKALQNVLPDSKS
jgi:uncharacterized coiled-coil DUF342 family protein